MSTPDNPQPTSGATTLFGYLGQTESALDTITKILTTLTLLGGAASAFAQQGTGRIVAGVVVILSIVVLLWRLRRPLHAGVPGGGEPAVRPSLRGLLHFDVGEPLYERKRVLAALYGRTIARGARVNIVIGDAHCGKTSLLLAGLVTALSSTPEQQAWLPVYVAHPGHTIDPTWSPEAEIAEALARASDTPPAASLGEALERAIAARPNSTFVVIYDQFEQFFLANPAPEARAGLLDWVGKCVADDDLAVRFVFAIRSGFEACVSEMERAIEQPVSVNFQTMVTRFQPSEARRALDAIVEHDELPFAPGLRSALVRDVTRSGSVCPAELQIVSRWLYERGINTVASYELAGQADGLFSEFLSDQTRRIDQLAATNVAGKILLALARKSAGHQLEALSRDELVRSVAPEEPAASDGGMRLVRGPLDSALAQLMLGGLVIEEPDHRYRLVHDYFAEYVLQLHRPKTTMGTLHRLPRALAAAYGTKAGVGVAAALLVLLLGACTVAQTKAAKIDTLPSSASLSNPGFQVFGSNGQLFAVGDDSAPGLTFGVEVWNLPDRKSTTPLPNADLRTLESQQASVRQWVERGYTVLFIGQPDRAEASAAAAVDAARVHVVQRQEDVAQVQVDDPERVAYVSQTTFASDEIDTVKRSIRDRLPGSIDADRRQFVPLGLEFSSDGRTLRLVAVGQSSEQWGVWSWDLTQPQRPATYRTGSLQGKGPACAAQNATISRGVVGQALLAIGYSCGPILLIKPDNSGPVYSEPVNRQTEEQPCKNLQLFFASNGDLYALYQCISADKPTAYRLRHWTPGESVWTGDSAGASSPQPGDVVVGGTPKEAKELKFPDDPTVKAVVVDSNDVLRAVVRAQTLVELRAVDKGNRLSWLDVGDIGDASPSPDGRFVVRTTNVNDVTVFDLYEMGAWIDTGTTFGSVRLWSWMEDVRDRLPVMFGR